MDSTADLIDKERIAHCMLDLVNIYNDLRFSRNPCLDFWDVVVLSASNEDQKYGYEKMISHRQNGPNPLPASTYLVIADPEGCKIGNGGATLHILKSLFAKFGDVLFLKRILLLHCGGWSQRLPSTSALGKIFSPLPLGQPMLEFLDIKLCNYLPFIDGMKPGVFLVSSDDIQPFFLPDAALPDCCKFNKQGFTVLAHPSPLPIGTKHGVYVLPTINSTEVCYSTPVAKVLQKPTTEKMYEAGAVLKTSSHVEYCLSDSAFYFCHQITRKLLRFYDSIPSLDCELDAYGDFLQCLGYNSNSTYVTDERNVSSISASLRETRLKVYDLLHSEPVHALVLMQSAYIHFGTMPEYIYNMVDPNFVNGQGKASNPGLRHFIEIFSEKTSCVSIVDSYLHSSTTLTFPSCIMRSVIGPNVSLGTGTVVEYSVINAPAIIGKNCIISQCLWRKGLQDSLHIGDGIFLYTIAVTGNKFATVCFGVFDDIKATNNIDSIQYLNGLSTLGDMFKFIGSSYSKHDALNLWSAPIFSLSDSPEQSLFDTLQEYNAIQSHSSLRPKSVPRFSMADLLSMKDIDTTISLRLTALGSCQLFT